MYIKKETSNGNKSVAYTIENYQRPSDDVSTEDKSKKDYNLGWQRYIYSSHISGGSAISLKDYDVFDENRAYGEGNQDIQQYIDRFDPTQAIKDVGSTLSSSKRVGYSNINFNIIPIIPEFRDVFIGLMMSIDHDVVMRAIDPMSNTIRQEEVERMYATKQLQEIFKKYGVAIKEEGYMPSSMQEMELYLKMGLHKFRFESGMEKVLTHMFDKSKWDKDIRERLYGDIFDINVICCEDYVDVKNKRVMTRYLDPKKVIIPYIDRFEYNSYDYGAYQFDITIAEFRRENPDLSEEKIRSLASLMKGEYNNPSVTLDSVSTFEARGTCNYDGFILPCMRAYYKTINKDKEVTKVQIPAKRKKIKDEELASGKVYMEDGKYYKNKEREEIYRTIYGSKWVIGTDHVWGFGVINDVPRYEDDVVIPIHCVKIKGKSLNERAQINSDNMQMAWLKFQNAWSNAAPKGLIIDELSITSTAGGQGIKPKELMRIRKIQGDMTLNFHPMSQHNLGGRAANGVPFQEIEGGVGNILNEFITTWTWNLGVIQKSLGINDVVDASNPNPEITKGQADLAMIATNNALKTRYNAYLKLKENLCTNATVRAMRLIYDNDNKELGYYSVIGEPYIISIKEAYKRGLSPADMGISIKARPTQKEMYEMEMMLNKAITSGRNGKPTITASDYFLIKNLLTEPSGMLMAQSLLALFEDKRMQEEAAQNQQLQQIMAEEARKTKQQEAMIEEQTAKTEHERKKELLILEADLKLRNEQQLHQNTMRENTSKANMDLKNSLLTELAKPQPNVKQGANS